LNIWNDLNRGSGCGVRLSGTVILLVIATWDAGISCYSAQELK